MLHSATNLNGKVVYINDVGYVCQCALQHFVLFDVKAVFVGHFSFRSCTDFVSRAVTVSHQDHASHAEAKKCQ
eukprot:3237910-Amphidinium_carterae.1